MVPVNRAGWGIIGRTSVLWSEEMKDLLLKMSVMAVSLAIGIVMCEVAIRYIEPQRLDFVRPIYDADEDLIFKLRKNPRSFTLRSGECADCETTPTFQQMQHQVGQDH